MSLCAEWAPYRLDFKFLARTSRNAMRHKDTYFVRIPRPDGNGYGVGECALFRGLGADDLPDYEERLAEACTDVSVPSPYSSIRFGIETALADAGITPVPDSPFRRGESGIPINGLIWMGDRDEMRRRIDGKLDAGFNVLKLKIGGIDFDSECALLDYIRSRYSPATLELRLDANGSFRPGEALRRLERLSVYSVHSIEQPVAAGQTDVMADLCRRSPVDIALDEELIGMPDAESVARVCDVISPRYLILKSALCGGLSGAEMWAGEADRRGIGWWATSALESNVGLLAIASMVAARGVSVPQGLGTGQLYYNNVPSGLYLRGQYLWFDPGVKFSMPDLQWRR